MKKIIKVHSTIDYITNSSSEIFTISNEMGVDSVREIIRNKCEVEGDLEWFESEVSINSIDDDNIEIYSFLNDPDWFNDFVEETFNVIDTWYGG